MDLSVVMPVYNEAAGIGRVLEEWTGALDRLRIDYEILVYDDGSLDATPQVLAELARRSSKIVVRRHENRGHGPTILRGYREAAGDWIFQVDSDGEIGPESFGAFWECRHDADLMLGYRKGRRSRIGRRLITAGARLAVTALFGGRIRDPNSPYRLIRHDALQRLVSDLPRDIFAPNVALSGLAVRAGLRIVQHPVLHRSRGSGTGGILGWRAWRVASRSLWELAAIARTARASRGPARNRVVG